jgi:acyl dehydratase
VGARQIPSGHGRMMARPSTGFSNSCPDASESVSGHGLRLNFQRILSTAPDPRKASTMRMVNFADLESLVGTEVGASPWHQITQSQINKFAEATGDHQWIHVDVERATKELGAPIAHGYLTLSLLPMLAAQIMRVENVTRGINFGCNKVRFTNMVPVGSRVRLRQKCLAVESRAGGKQIVMESTIEIEGKDRPACVAESIGIIYGA